MQGGAHARAGAGSGAGANVVRLRPLRVLVVSGDRRFRAVSAMLLARRGCSAVQLAAAERTGALLAGGHVDVAIVDGMAQLRDFAEQLMNVAPLPVPLGLVVAFDRGERVPHELVSVDKWASFEDVFAAIERADRRRVRRRDGEHARRLSLIASDGRP